MTQRLRGSERVTQGWFEGFFWGKSDLKGFSEGRVIWRVSLREWDLRLKVIEIKRLEEGYTRVIWRVFWGNETYGGSFEVLARRRRRSGRNVARRLRLAPDGVVQRRRFALFCKIYANKTNKIITTDHYNNSNNNQHHKYNNDNKSTWTSWSLDWWASETKNEGKYRSSLGKTR